MSPPSPSKKRRRLILLSTIILALICWAYFAPSELDRYKAQLIAQGEILDLDQLAPKRTGHEPDGDAPLLAAQQQITNGFTLRIGQFGFKHTDQGIQQLEWKSLITNAVAEINAKRADFLLLNQLLQNPPKEKGGDYREFLNYKYPENELRRHIARHLHHAVTVSAYARDSSMAFTNLVTLLNLAQLHREEWDSTSQSTRSSITKLALEDLNYCLHLRFWDEPQLADLQTKLESISLVTNTIQAMVMDRARVSVLFAQIRQDPRIFITNAFSRPLSSKDQFRITYWHRVDLGNDELTFLKILQKRLDIFREQTNSPAWASTAKPLNYLYHEVMRTTHSCWTDNKISLTEIFSQSHRDAEPLAYAETRRQQAITVLALERYRLKYNRYPDTLTQLIPDYLAKLPQDPMDGRPMRYRLNPDATFTLWSSGFDGKDNGGDPSILSLLRFPHGALDLPWPKLDPADLPPNP
ncbi:MAG: hypothetical protein ACO1QS_04925 [Verrucomicrobiota bacterium]